MTASRITQRLLTPVSSTFADWLDGCREHAGWLAFLAFLVILGFALTTKLPGFMGVAATGVGESAIFADYLSAALLAVVFRR